MFGKGGADYFNYFNKTANVKTSAAKLATLSVRAVSWKVTKIIKVLRSHIGAIKVTKVVKGLFAMTNLKCP